MKKNPAPTESHNDAEQKAIKRSNGKIWTSLLVSFLLVIGLVAASMMLKNQQDLRQHAAVDCGTTLQGKVDLAASGQTVDLTGCSYTGTVNITKPITLIGGSLSSQTLDPWKPAIEVNSDNVTIQNWQFDGGGVVISILGHSNVIVLNNTFSNQINSAIAIWGGNNGANNVTIDGNTIKQTKTNKTSPIIGRASEDCSVFSKNTAFKNNKIDQGEGTLGWFGVELKCHDGVIFDNNTFHGGETLVSLPDTNNVTFTNNTFDMTGNAYWGIEVAHANNVNVSNNSFLGDGPNGTDHAVSLNSGSLNTTVNGNSASNLRTLVDVGGNYITITNNCLTNVLRLTEFDSSGQVVTKSNNGPCANSPTPLPTSQPLPTSPSAAPTSTPKPTPSPIPTISNADTTSPQVGITNPVNGSIVKVRSNLNIQANATDNVGVTKVDFYINGSLICSDSSTPYLCVWRVPGSRNKKYSITATALDTAGNTSTANISITAR